MRLLLLLLLGIGSLLGSASPVAAHQATEPMARTASGPCGSPQQHCPADHVCVGCAVSPEAAPAMPRIVLEPSPLPVAALLPALPDHRTGFDPPPPRLRA